MINQSILKCKQQELLFKHLPVSILTGYIAVLFATFVLWDFTGNKPFIIWLAVFNLIMLYRFIILFRYRDRVIDVENLSSAEILNFVSTLMTGFIWGALTLFFSVHWPTEIQVALWVLLMSLMSGASASFSVAYKHYLAYCIPIVLFSLYVQFIFNNYYLMFVFFAYSFLLTLTSLNFHKAHIQILKSQLELEQSNVQLKSLAASDPLTGLPNRRAFEDYYKKEWDRHVRSHSIMSLMMIDVDYFKNYNDNYGHDEGDKCLKALSGIILKSLHRPADRVARFGGEEFIVLLPETTNEGAIEVAERIHGNLLEESIPHGYSTASELLTVSIGIATHQPKVQEDTKILLLTADRELYKAKSMGRNSTAHHDEEDSL